MGLPKKCVEEFGTFVNLEFYSTCTYNFYVKTKLLQKGKIEREAVRVRVRGTLWPDCFTASTALQLLHLQSDETQVGADRSAHARQ